jgi:hypothetical protein
MAAGASETGIYYFKNNQVQAISWKQTSYGIVSCAAFV